MNEYAPGEKVLVRNRNGEDWTDRWYVGPNPFNDKHVTLNSVGTYESWFQVNKLKLNTNDAGKPNNTSSVR